MNKISRLQERHCANHLFRNDSRDVLLVQGARQVGKTTMIHSVLESSSDTIYALNLERDQDVLRQIDRTESFAEFSRVLSLYWKVTTIDRPGTVLFIDEAQESEHLGRYVRFMKEEWQHIRVVLSGSSMSRIFRDETRVPVGRFRPLLVTPFVFEEFLAVSGLTHLQQVFEEFCGNMKEGLIDEPLHSAFIEVLDDYLAVGGLPAVATNYYAGGDYRGLRRALYDAQEDDFVRKSSLSDRSLFAKGLRGVANYIGMPSKFGHIDDAKITANMILSTQTAWHLIYEIEQKSMSSTTQHLPKRYLYDIGMAQDLRDMPFPRLSLVSTKNPALRTQLGGLFENALLIALISNQARLGDISGWRSGGSDSPEVDFIWRQDQHTIAFECKATQNVSLKHWSSLKAYLEAIKDINTANIGFLVSAAPFKVVQSKHGTLINLPLYLASGSIIRNLVHKYL